MEERRQKNSPDRDSTDASLLDEREKTDTELARRRTAVEETADRVVQKARRRADAVLQKQRDAVDNPASGTHAEPVEAARLRADSAIVAERASEDEAAAFEREARRRALTDLLEQERDQTDQHLFTERGSSDAAVASRDNFLAMVSHDLRSMLNGIALTAALLIKEAPADESRTSVRARA